MLLTLPDFKPYCETFFLNFIALISLISIALELFDLSKLAAVVV